MSLEMEPSFVLAELISLVCFQNLACGLSRELHVTFYLSNSIDDFILGWCKNDVVFFFTYLYLIKKNDIFALT